MKLFTPIKLLSLFIQVLSPIEIKIIKSIVIK